MNVDPSAMTVKNLRQELESLGIDTQSFLEKSEFIDALLTARKGGKHGGGRNVAAVSAAVRTPNQRRLSTPVAIDAVPGLFVQTEFFSHDVENSLYNDRYLFTETPEQIVGPIASQFRSKNPGKRFLRHGPPKAGFQAGIGMPEALVKTCNGIVESGLYNDFIACDYCLPWSYPENGSFNYHFDSRHRWGETVVGICLGCPGVMSFQLDPKVAKGKGQPPPPSTRRSLNSDGLAVTVRKNWIVDVHLPPRSLYVMSGPTRTEWKHMVLSNNTTNRMYLGSNPNPSFTNCIVRRTITLRSTRIFSEELLRQASLQLPNDTALKVRIHAQSKFHHEKDYGSGKATKQEVQVMRQRAEREVSTIHASFRKIFFNDRECGYERRNPGRFCWPLKGDAKAGGYDNIHSATTVAHGGSVEASFATSFAASFATSFAASIANPKRATAWSLPDHLPMTGTSAQTLSESSSLSNDELRAKRLEKFESGTKRKEPSCEVRPVLSRTNVVNLLNDGSDDEGEMQMTKKEKKSEDIHLND